MAEVSEVPSSRYNMRRQSSSEVSKRPDQPGARLHELLASLVEVPEVDSPLRYSGRPVMSAIPSTLQPNTSSIGSTKEYVIHWVSLWNGTKSSPKAAPLLAFVEGLNLTFSGTFDCGFASTASAWQGHTSPRATPFNDVLSVGQMADRPSMRTPNKADTGIHVLPSASRDCVFRKSM